jgi:16S rRNA (guanine966-N2)-methyltransferase
MLGYSVCGTRKSTAMRVISGKYGGRILRSLSGQDIRPTSDRLRETLFNVLTAGNPAALDGTVWMDVFAGTGAVGIEALSRGAKQVYFVENSDRAARLIERNLESLSIKEGFKILHDDLASILWRSKRQHVVADVVFLDPPYHKREAYKETLEAIADSNLVWAMSVVIAQHEKQFELSGEYGSLGRFRKLVQGNNVLSFYRIGGSPDINERRTRKTTD